MAIDFCVNAQIDSSIKVRKIEELIDLPKAVLVNKFDEEAAKNFRNSFFDAVNTKQPIIPVVIDSYGGQCYSLLSMAGVIKQSPVPVATILTGKAMSCGALLFSYGSEGYRFMDPFSTMMIHEVSNCAHGKVEEVKVDAAETDRLNKLLFKMMANNIGKADDYFLNIIHEKSHADWYLNAIEAKSHNLANHLRIPIFKVKISSEITFE